MIQVVVGRNDVADRFRGKFFLNRFHHRRGAGFIKRPFDGDQMIAHFDDDGGVADPLDFVYAVGQAIPFDGRAGGPCPDSSRCRRPGAGSIARRWASHPFSARAPTPAR